MRPAVRGILWVGGGLAFLAIATFLLAVPRFVDGRLNATAPAPAPTVGARAESLHATFRIADLHDDLLLWDRPILGGARRGHTDLPRLTAGGVAVQVFSTVTRVPVGLNYERNAAESDQLLPLLIAARWPVRTWGSPFARALHQGRRLERAAAASRGALAVARSRLELEAALETRARTGRPGVIGLLSTEGLQALDGTLAHVDSLFAFGFRLAGLTHFFDNPVAGSAHGVAKGGLTSLGRDVVRRMEALGMVVDLAHASPATMEEVLAMATRPVVVSHTGVASTCPRPRNLTDRQLMALAANGALIGIGFWDGAVCDPSPRSVAAAIRHAVDVAGPDRVALGSDWDGATTVAITPGRLPQLTQALLDAGLDEGTIRKVMGENAIRFFLAWLP